MSVRAVTMMIGTPLCRRISRQQPNPSIPGNMMSMMTTSKGCVASATPNATQRVLAAADFCYLVAFVLEGEPHRGANSLVVLNDQDLTRHAPILPGRGRPR